MMKKLCIALALALALAMCPALATRAQDAAEPYLTENAAWALAELGETVRYEVYDCVDDATKVVLLDQSLFVSSSAEGTLWITTDRAVSKGADGAARLMVFPEEYELELFRLQALSPLDPDEFMVVLETREGADGTLITGVVDDPELVYDLLAGHTDIFQPGDTLNERCLFDADGRITAIERDLVRAGGEILPLSRTAVSLGADMESAEPLPDTGAEPTHTLTWILDPGAPDERAVTAEASRGVGFACALTDAYDALWQDAACTIPADASDAEGDITVYSVSAYEEDPEFAEAVG